MPALFGGATGGEPGNVLTVGGFGSSRSRLQNHFEILTEGSRRTAAAWTCMISRKCVFCSLEQSSLEQSSLEQSSLEQWSAVVRSTSQTSPVFEETGVSGSFSKGNSLIFDRLGPPVSRLVGGPPLSVCRNASVDGFRLFQRLRLSKNQNILPGGDRRTAAGRSSTVSHSSSHVSESWFF